MKEYQDLPESVVNDILGNPSVQNDDELKALLEVIQSCLFLVEIRSDNKYLVDMCSEQIHRCINIINKKIK